MKTRLYHILFISLALVCWGCNSQQNKERVSVIQTDLDRYNLKGKVKEVVTSYQRFYPIDSLSEKKIREYESMNDLVWREKNALGKQLFDKHGFLKKSYHKYRDSIGIPVFDVLNKYKYIYIYDSIDYDKKKKIKANKKYLHPVYSPNKVNVNYIFFDEKDFIKDSLNREYTYVYHLYNIQNNKIKKERITYQDEEKSFFPDSMITSKSTLYSYNDKELITQQQVMYYENTTVNILPDNIQHLNMEVPAHSENLYFFQYDDQERVTQVKLTVNGERLWQEDYKYKDKQERPYQLIKYITSVNTYGNYHTEDITEYYNTHGDITKSINYDKQGNVVRTRFYDYKYDNVGNWVECKMYLEGGEKRTEKPTMVAKREFSYYEDGL